MSLCKFYIYRTFIWWDMSENNINYILKSHLIFTYIWNYKNQTQIMHLRHTKIESDPASFPCFVRDQGNACWLLNSADVSTSIFALFNDA